MLRVWNPGRNEPREQREGEGEAEVVETLIEVDEEAAEAPVAVALGRRPGARRAGRTPPHPADRLLPGVDPHGSDEAGATTGLHVPRRTHRRIVKGPRPYREPWSNPVLWRELMTRAYGTKPLIIKGAYVLLFALGVAVFHTLGRGMESPLSSRSWR